MKIIIARWPKEHLSEGLHSVKITKILNGRNQNNIEYFDCFFENNQGSCSSRYYITEKAMFRVIALFRACNLSAENNQTVDTDDLIGKELKIENVSKLRDGSQFVDTVAVYPLPINTGDEVAPFQNPFEDDDDDGLPT
jgi:hypothetical protein